MGKSNTSNKEGLYSVIQNTSSRDHKSFIKNVIRESNKDQSDLVERYNRSFSKV
ncbi:MAG: hypothetical protein WCW54_00740 [Candidatus Paceibacterota bacterium]